MITMEIAMNATDYILTGGAILNWWIVPIMLTVVFNTWPYNYWGEKIQSKLSLNEKFLTILFIELLNFTTIFC